MSLRMALGTILCKHQIDVVGVRGSFIICLVTAKTLIGRVVVIAVVTGSTIIGNGGMSAVQCIVVVVDGEGSRCPARFGGMAGCTIRWQSQSNVIRIGGLVEIRQVAGVAIGRGSCIAATVAGCAFCNYVCTGQGECRAVVVKHQICIAGGVAGQTGGIFEDITVDALVLVARTWIGMANYTTEFGKIVRVGVAIRTLVPFSFVLTSVNRKILTIVVEICRHPFRL